MESKQKEKKCQIKIHNIFFLHSFEKYCFTQKTFLSRTIAKLVFTSKFVNVFLVGTKFKLSEESCYYFA